MASKTSEKAGGRVGIVGTGHRARVSFDLLSQLPTFHFLFLSFPLLHVVLHTSYLTSTYFPLPIHVNDRSLVRWLTFSSTPMQSPPDPRLS